jgi:predicted DNA-binding ribbon-helix-helix protein
MKSLVVKRSVTIGGHKTSVTLEDVFWEGLHEIAEDRCVPVKSLLGEIDLNRPAANLSSHIRLFVLDYYRSRLRASEHGSADRHAASIS